MEKKKLNSQGILKVWQTTDKLSPIPSQSFLHSGLGWDRVNFLCSSWQNLTWICAGSCWEHRDVSIIAEQISAPHLTCEGWGCRGSWGHRQPQG